MSVQYSEFWNLRYQNRYGIEKVRLILYKRNAIKIISMSSVTRIVAIVEEDTEKKPIEATNRAIISL